MSQNDPCASCPYRKDVPSGLWEKAEYDKILPYDNDTWDQPLVTFGCHKNDDTVCRGWLHCHGTNLLAIRISWTPVIGLCLEQGTKIPLFKSAKAAAKHGMKDIKRPSRRATKFMAMIDKTRRKKNAN